MSLLARLMAIRRACPVNRLTLLLAGRTTRTWSALRGRWAGRRTAGRGGTD